MGSRAVVSAGDRQYTATYWHFAKKEAAVYPWKPVPLPSPFAWPSPAPTDSIAPLFTGSPVFRPAYDPVSGLPLIYRSMYEWQDLARIGSLRPDAQLYNPHRGVWQRAIDYPALRPYFPPPPPPSWVGLVGLGLGVLALSAIAEACLNSGLDGLRWDDLRREIFRRDDYTCTYCRHRGNNSTLEVDHRTPVSRGGGDNPENLVTSCWSCNVDKGTRTEWEYRIARLLK